MREKKEQWDHRASLAETAINERHARRLWGLPATNLPVVSWPAATRDKVYVRWHYWWQAHYLDCLVDAASRLPTRERAKRIDRTMRAIRLRNMGPLTKNRYYDDKAWLALALDRVQGLGHGHRARGLADLQQNIIEGIEPTGVLPWRAGESFYNAPTNGPAAIMLARMGRLDEAETITDWIFDNLINDEGLVMDGIRLTMNGPETAPATYAYNQGVALGACVEIAKRRRAEAGLTPEDRSDLGMSSITRVHNLVHSVAVSMATESGVIKGAGSGDGGLFKGILMRYLAFVALELPDEQRLSRATKRVAARLVIDSAEAAWENRLEVSGLPVFSADWTREARLPQATGFVGSSGAEIAERDLSVQLSGWMLMEAAAAIAAR